MGNANDTTKTLLSPSTTAEVEPTTKKTHTQSTSDSETVAHAYGWVVSQRKTLKLLSSSRVVIIFPCMYCVVAGAFFSGWCVHSNNRNRFDEKCHGIFYRREGCALRDNENANDGSTTKLHFTSNNAIERMAIIDSARSWWWQRNEFRYTIVRLEFDVNSMADEIEMSIHQQHLCRMPFEKNYSESCSNSHFIDITQLILLSSSRHKMLYVWCGIKAKQFLYCYAYAEDANRMRLLQPLFYAQLFNIFIAGCDWNGIESMVTAVGLLRFLFEPNHTQTHTFSLIQFPFFPFFLPFFSISF